MKNTVLVSHFEIEQTTICNNEYVARVNNNELSKNDHRKADVIKHCTVRNHCRW